MLSFNIPNPNLPDFDERIVSPESDPDRRPMLVAYVRKLLATRATILQEPRATKTHTSAELAEMGFVSVTIHDEPLTAL